MTTKRAKRIEKRNERFEKRQAKRIARHARIAKFFEFKFLRTKRFLAVERHRENVKTAFNVVSALLYAAIAVIVGFAVGTAVGIGVLAILVWADLKVPVIYRAVKARRKARFTLRAQALEAEQWYHSKVAEKVEYARRKAHSKADKKKNKAMGKHQAVIAKDNVKANKKAQKQSVRTNIDTTFKVEVKEEAKATDLNVKLK